MSKHKLALVNMPFASSSYPSLALGTLKSIAIREKHWAQVFNFNLNFSKIIGVSNYEVLAQGGSGLLGEQVFSHLIHPERDNDSQFVKYIEKFTAYSDFLELVALARNYVENCADILEMYDPSIVGFTTTFYQKMASIALASRLKVKLPNSKIIFGGAACELPMGTALLKAYSCIDVCFFGDAENSLVRFMNFQNSDKGTYAEIPGICYKTKEGEVKVSNAKVHPTSLDENPIPCFEDYLRQIKWLDLGDKVKWSIPLETSRGCWWGEKHHCTFCGLNGSQMTFRHKSEDKIINEIFKVKENTNTQKITFTDNILYHRFFKTLIPKLGEVKDVEYFFEVKSNLKIKDVEVLAKNKVSSIQPGIERLDDHVLSLMKKGTNAKINLQLLAWCASYNIDVQWSILYGFAGERVSNIYNEIELMSQIRNLQPPAGASKIRVDRFSPNYNSADAHGIKITGPSDAEHYLFNKHPLSRDMAYHFNYQHIEKPNEKLKLAWSKLRKEVEIWRNAYRPNLLTYESVANGILIKDSRNFKRPLEVELSGETAKFFEYCLKARGTSNLSKLFERPVQHIRNLKDLGLIVHQDTWMMSIATKFIED